MKNRLIYSVSVAVLAAGMMVACGNGDDDDTTPTADAGTDSSTTTKLDGSTGPEASTTADGSTPTDSGAADTGTADAGDAGLAPTFTNVYATIIGTVCKGCHTGGSGETDGKLLMDTQADAYTNLVGSGSGVPAAGSGCATSGEDRVVKGDSATSLLWQKVNGTQTCGSRMPLGEGDLTQAQIALIAAWINAGALDN
jgi:hypothetical protein